MHQGGDPERKSARGHVFSSPSWTRVRGFRASGVRVRGFGLRWNDKCIFTSLPKASLKLAQIPMTFTISGRGQPRSSFLSQGPGSSLWSLSQPCLIRVAALIDFTLFSIRVAPLNAKHKRFRFVRALLGLGFMVFALLG